MKSFINYFYCGNYILHPKKEWGYYQCTKFLDNYEIIIPFFKKHLIKGVKAKDFSDWIKIAEIIKNKNHLTKEGSIEIINIKSKMNKGRIND
jgi:hypothetical protein